MVTKRMAGLKVGGKKIFQVGLPIHWGFLGKVSGPLINNLTASVYDPNSGTPEYKGFLVSLEKV
jgi:formate dehydrogenase major subunit